MCVIVSSLIAFIVMVTSSHQQSSQVINVCPSQNDVILPLADFKHHAICSNITDCDTIKTVFRGRYFPLVIVIVDDSNRYNAGRLIEKLSLCGIENIVINSLLTDPINLINVCKADGNIIVFNFVEQIYDFIEPYSNQTGCLIRSDLNGKLMYNILATCPNTLWVFGEDKCFNNTSTIFGLTLHNYGITNVTLANGSDQGQTWFHKTLIVTSIIYPPFLNKTISRDGTAVYNGIVIEMLDKMASNLQFNYVMIEPPDGNAGILVNGSWNGMIRMLIDKEVDIIAAPMTHTALRDTVLEFSSSFYYESIGIMIRVPGKGESLWRMFVLFSKEIWLYVLLVSFVSTFVLYALHKLSPVPLDSEFEHFGNCLWYVFSCMANQGGEYDPVSWSAQNFLAFFWLFVFIFISMYSGGLIATLTTSGFSLPFKNLAELAEVVKRNEFKICLQGNTGFHQAILSNSTLSEYKIFNTWLKENPGYDGTEENCIQKILKSSQIAFLQEMTRLQEIQTEHCFDNPLVILDDQFYPGYESFALQKDAPINTFISLDITDSFQFGLIDKWKRLYQTKPKFCKVVQPNDVIRANMESLTITEFGGPFLLFVVGLVLSVLIFIVERVRYRFRRSMNSVKL